ncbi:MAG: hypothetical protein H6738_24435 [Alphaproteobacteria bacterium]|nr:hypothetical protein [Alphaproteobacteria bacterium]
MTRLVTSVLLGALLPAVAAAQAGPADPGIRVPLTSTVSAEAVGDMRFLQHGDVITGWIEWGPRSTEILFHAAAPIGSDAPVIFDFPEEILGAIEPLGPTYSPDLQLAAPCVLDTTDTDEDGLPDCAEQPGQSYWGHWLSVEGATVGARDLFVKVGYLHDPVDKVRPWMRPFPQALAKVRDALADGGITVHFDVGDLYETDDYDGFLPGFAGVFDIDHADHGFPYATNIGWVEPAPQCSASFTCGLTTYPGGWKDGTPHTNFLTTYRQALIPSYDPVWSFVLFSHVSTGSSGVSYRDGANAAISVASGNDTKLTLDPDPVGTSWWRPRTEDEVYNKTVNYQAGTLIHELGHLFGLREGGLDDIEGKPNYVSSMSYVYQNTGLPHDHADMVIRHQNFDHAFLGGPCAEVFGSDIPHGPLGDPADFRIGYSSTEESLLDEADLDEVIGFYETGSVDWNCDGQLQSSVQVNITGKTWVPSPNPDTCGSVDGTAHDDQLSVSANDWGVIQLPPQRHLGQPAPNDGLPFVCALP